MMAVEAEKERAEGKDMPPDMAVRMGAVVLSPEFPGFLVITDRDFIGKRKIVLEDFPVFHYTILVSAGANVSLPFA